MKFLLAVLVCAPLFGQATVSINSTSTGTSWFGIGALSGATSKLLYDYPATQQNEILDYLFCKPNPSSAPVTGYCTSGIYGAALDILSMQIPSDAQEGEGAEPSFERVSGTTNFTLGYIWWLIQQAKNRNPAILLRGLVWSAPNWTGSAGSFLSNPAAYKYLTDFANGLYANYGYHLDYLGFWNENAPNATWIKGLYTYLQANTAGTTAPLLMAADQATGSQWAIGPSLTDPTLASNIAVYGDHYLTTPASGSNSCTGTNYGDVTAQAKPIIESEGGVWGTHTPSGDWTGAQLIAQELINNFINCGAAGTILWAMTTSYLDNLPLPQAGMTTAQSPWSGHYSIDPGIWIIGHVAQFAKPADTVIASGTFSPGCSTCTYMVIRAANATDYTVFAQNPTGSSTTLTVNLSGALSTGTVHQTVSFSSSQFAAGSNITPSAGSWSATLSANTIYTFSTISVPAKVTTTPPAPSAFPYPYYDYFTGYATGKIPKYLSPVNGGWETGPCTVIAAPECLEQTVTLLPVSWTSNFPADEPLAIIGSPTWTDQTFGVTAAITGTGSLKLAARVAGFSAGGGCSTYCGQPDAYEFYINNSGTWKISLYNIGYPASTNLASGTASAPNNASHSYQMSVTGCSPSATITVKMDGTTIATATDNGGGAGTCYTASGSVGIGMASTAQAGVSTASYVTGEFSTLWIGSQPPPPTISGATFF